MFVHKSFVIPRCPLPLHGAHCYPTLPAATPRCTLPLHGAHCHSTVPTATPRCTLPLHAAHCYPTVPTATPRRPLPLHGALCYPTLPAATPRCPLLPHGAHYHPTQLTSTFCYHVGSLSSAPSRLVLRRTKRTPAWCHHGVAFYTLQLCPVYLWKQQCLSSRKNDGARWASSRQWQS